MKIAIISDIHNNLTNLKKALDYCASNNIAKIICCGDLASLEVLDFLNDNFKGNIFFTFGNMDDDFLSSILCHPERSRQSGRVEGSSEFKKVDSLPAGRQARHPLGMTYKNTQIFKKFGEAEIDNRKIAFVHYPREAKKLAETEKYNFVFYGHTHKPWEEMINNCKMLNPGNVAGEIYPPTFAVWNTGNDKFELIRVHNLK